MDPYLVLLLAAICLSWATDALAEFLNIRHLKSEPPPAFHDVMDPDTFNTSQAYSRATGSLRLVSSTVVTAVLVALLLAGAFGRLHNALTGLGQPQLVTGLFFFACLGAGFGLLSLPFDLYSTFVIEERFGFNRTSIKTFLLDKVKGLCLLLLLGTPLLALVLYLLERSSLWMWLPAWAGIGLFMLLIRFIGPTLILPLFNRFEPLAEGPLRESITSYAKEQDFELSGIFVMDGSKRSSKSNAFFTGLGRTKRIALFDTLIERHTEEEILVVLAHEIGHYKKKHIPIQTAISLFQLGALLFLLFVTAGHHPLYAAFGAPPSGVHLGLLYFSLAFSPVSLLLALPANKLSRRFEYQADRFAAATTGKPQHMVNALKKLARDNLSNLTPHPFYVLLHASHPPLVERIEALETFEKQTVLR